MQREAALYFRNQFRQARALVLRDAEAFDEVVHVVERMGLFLNKESRGLGAYRVKIDEEAKRSSLAYDAPGRWPQLHIPFGELFDLVRNARNYAMHQGAVARHLTSHATKIALVLEDALMNGNSVNDAVRDFMVQNPVCAESWQPMSFIRQMMLENSFSVLPVNCGRESTPAWKLVSDVDVARYLRTGAREQRHQRLVETLLEAQQKSGGIKLKEPNYCKPEDSAAIELSDGKELPFLVTDSGNATGRLLGIVTTFDLL